MTTEQAKTAKAFHSSPQGKEVERTAENWGLKTPNSFSGLFHHALMIRHCAALPFWKIVPLFCVERSMERLCGTIAVQPFHIWNGGPPRRRPSAGHLRIWTS
jgi:hypothetical protein